VSTEEGSTEERSTEERSTEERSTEERSTEEPPANAADILALARLGYLLKHVQLSFAALANAALAPYGINGRELAVLTFLSRRDPLSQQEAAHGLGVDRTTMVALIDDLERKGLVKRTAHPKDRRKNIVAVTGAGRETMAGATRAADAAERRFLAPLGEAGARQLKEALRALVSAS
jgi:DNA-binding MarR family transcriptional regulator